MTAAHFRSSGDLNADRRYAYAVDLLQEGDARAAVDLLDQTLELVPDWSVAWFTLGRAREAAGNAEAAIAAFRRASDLDIEGILGTELHLARIGAAGTPSQPPAAYVRGLFDDYADRFDDALVNGLAYRAPQLIAEALARAAPEKQFAHCLDLGCGTGLMAQELRSKVGAMTGVDLSARMVDTARAKRLYDELIVGDVVTAMTAAPDGSYDLVTAADVFCYLGDLAPAITEVARVLRPGGRLAFSVESLPEGAMCDNYVLAESLRFRHNTKYLAGLIHQAHLACEHIAREALRNDRGIPVEGLIVIASKPSESAI